MHHFFEAITNTKGDALIGYFVRLADTSDDSAITVYADSSLTPIVSVSGLADAAKVDTDGMASLWVPSGTYHMDIYATDGATLVRRETFVQMGVPAGDYGDVSVADGDAWTVESVGGTAPTTVGLAVFGATDAAAARTAIGAVLGTDAQAHDADLDALAALSGTNTIYYRSAASTWTAVTYGSVLSFSGGVLSVTSAKEWAPNWSADGTMYIPARVAMTIDQGNAAIGTGTITFQKSTNAAPSTFSSTTLPTTLEAGAWLKVSAASVSGFCATQLVRTA